MSDDPIPRRVLVLTAHADDCEFFAGGTVAKLAAAGAAVTEVIATDNGRGSFELGATELVSRSRDIEAREAARIIGKRELAFLGHPDGFLDELPKNELRRVFIGWIRRVRPDLLLSFDPWAPFESHPDHRHVGMAAVEAAAFSHMPLFHPEQAAEGLQPHLVPHCLWFAKDDRLCDHFEDIGRFIDQKIDALCVHESQMRLTIDDLRLSIEATGHNAELLPLLDRTNFRPAVDLLVRAWAGSVGARAGLDCAEAFRRQLAGAIFDAAAGGGR